MQRLKRIVHRRRSSNGDSSVVTLTVPKDELQELVSDTGVAPQKMGVLLKYTNVLKRWKRRMFILENGVLVYSALSGEDDNDGDESPTGPHDREKAKKKRSKKKRILRRVTSKDEKERDIKGSINLQFAVVSPDDSDDTRFAIDVGPDVFHCKAESRTERDDWVNALHGSNQYFRNLIERAVTRAKEAARVNLPVAADESKSISADGKEQLAKKPTLASGEVSDDSEDSFLEDDGLKEAEESRKALIAELRRVLALWRGQWVANGQQATSEHDVMRTLSETFRDVHTPPRSAEMPSQETAKGLLDLVAWCLHVVQTNDEMFDRRLKADLTRMMGGGLPVFPMSPDRHNVVSPQVSMPVGDDESDDEFVDALSRAASVRTSFARMDTWLEKPGELAEAEALVETPSDADMTEGEEQAVVKRVSTSVISRGYTGPRTRLPPLSGVKEKLNVFNLLKDSVGKDLSKISMPVTLNEPLSFLQRLAEDIEYSELLDQGAIEPDPERRMMYVAAMVISHLSSTQGRISKPFNPLLGETASFVRPDKGKGVRYIAEQVSHHPPVSACYAEGSEASWKYYNNIEVRNKFWGKSLEVFPTGLNHIEFPAYGDHYVFEQITSCVHNIVIGRMWLDNYGEMEIVNRTNGGVCKITFNKTGWMSDAKSFATIKATIYDPNGKPKIKLGGNWTKRVYEELPKGKKNIIWSVQERPSEDASQAYNMTKWAITLNAAVGDDEKDSLPPTDSRFRPDQRALELGQWELGSKLKQALEEGQRTRRREREEAGEEWEPRWFKKTIDDVTGMTDYLFAEEFFRCQARRDWKRSPDIFSCASLVKA